MRNMFLIMILCAVVWTCKDGDNPLESETGSGDDYEIYAKIIKSESIDVNNYLVILKDSTVYESVDSFQVERVRDGAPELLDQTINDYKSKNETSIKLKKIPGIDNIIWKSEYKGDGRNTVNIILSKVGYGDSNNQALVGIAVIHGPLAGSGFVVYLKKVNGEWQIKSKLATWIS